MSNGRNFLLSCFGNTSVGQDIKRWCRPHDILATSWALPHSLDQARDLRLRALRRTLRLILSFFCFLILPLMAGYPKTVIRCPSVSLDGAHLVHDHCRRLAT